MLCLLKKNRAGQMVEALPEYKQVLNLTFDEGFGCPGLEHQCAGIGSSCQ